MTALDLPAIQARVDATANPFSHFGAYEDPKQVFADLVAVLAHLEATTERSEVELGGANYVIDQVHAEVARLTAARDAALAVHAPELQDDGTHACTGCNDCEIPCATTRALTPKES